MFRNIRAIVRSTGKEMSVMRERKSIRRMNNGELRFYKSMLRLRRERRRKMLISTFAMLAVTCVIIVGCISYSSIRSSAGSGFKYYTRITVEAGETLWSLADEYIDYDYYKDKGRYVSEVKSINHLEEDGVIFAGQMLIVPYYSDEYVE